MNGVAPMTSTSPIFHPANWNGQALDVAGIAALMMQKDPLLVQSEVETILETTAIPMPAGCRDITSISGAPETVCWGPDAARAGLATADAALAATP